jgi:hypothetical protein
VEEIMAEFVKVTPKEQRATLDVEIAQLLEKHPDDLDEFFERRFQPEIIASEFSGSTRGFLEEIQTAIHG